MPTSSHTPSQNLPHQVQQCRKRNSTPYELSITVGLEDEFYRTAMGESYLCPCIGPRAQAEPITHVNECSASDIVSPRITYGPTPTPDASDSKPRPSLQRRATWAVSSHGRPTTDLPPQRSFSQHVRSTILTSLNFNGYYRRRQEAEARREARLARKMDDMIMARLLQIHQNPSIEEVFSQAQMHECLYGEYFRDEDEEDGEVPEGVQVQPMIGSLEVFDVGNRKKMALRRRCSVVVKDVLTRLVCTAKGIKRTKKGRARFDLD